jgi:hypothetical protein
MPDETDGTDAEAPPPTPKGVEPLPVEFAWIPPLIGFVAILGYALSRAGGRSEFLAYFSTGVMVGGTCLLLGAFLGFLFGIPRTLQQDRPDDHPPSAADDAATNRSSFDYRANTNLEQISDWLTRILVGAGLTQIPAISRGLTDAAARVGEGMGGGGTAFALALLLFFLVSGFLDGYLWTRLFLPGAFRQADLSTLATRVEAATREASQASRRVRELERQAAFDAQALALQERQMNPGTDTPPPTQEQLSEAVRKASKPVKIQIFAKATALRSDTWRTDKPKMELTIPIFRALVASEDERKYHRNHGQLGYALKDQRSPDWAGAEAALTEAIAAREAEGESGFRLYEFNRALCRISLEAAAGSGGPAPPETRERILADLREVARSKHRRIIGDEPNIQAWLARQGWDEAALAEDAKERPSRRPARP